MIPDYDDLPVDEVLGLPHSWGLLDPQVGTLSHITPDTVVVAAATVSLGERIPLNLSLGEIDPPLFGRERWRHSIRTIDRNTYEDVLDSFNPQSSSQWDGFAHIRARERGFYGGVTELDLAAESLAIEHLARRGIAGRGVLLDVAGLAARKGAPLDALAGDAIDSDALRRVAAEEGVELRAGDVLCVRTGWVSAYRGLPGERRGAPEVSARFSGLRADAEMARLLWNSRAAAVATDNPGFERAPGNAEDGFLHRRLLPMLGIVIGELLDLDRLAERCAAIGRYEFLFVAVPLPVPGGLSSPANAMALL